MAKRRRSAAPAELPALRRRAADGALTSRSALAFITLFMAPLLLVYLGTGDSTDMMELFNLVPVREAVRDHHWLMPTLNGVPRLEKPPLPVWVPAAFAVMAKSDSLWLLRVPSVLMALLTGFATYWIGLLTVPKREDGRKFGLLAACITASMFVFLRHARLASYDIYSTGFLTLGMVGLFGITDAAKGKNAFTLLAGAAIGLSILSKGPVPVATVCLPFGLYMLIFHRRLAVFARVAIAAVISVCVFLPWLIAVGHEYAAYHPWQVWYREILQNSTAVSNNPTQSPEDLKRPIVYYAQFFAWVAPHTPAFIAALVMPFLMRKLPPDEKPAPEEQRVRWAFWIIIVGGLLFISCLAEKKPRYALPLFPFAGLMCAGVWMDFARLPRERRIEPLGWLLLIAQSLFFVVPAVAGIGAIIWANNGTIPPSLLNAVQTLKSLPAALTFLLLMLTLVVGIYYTRLVRRRDFQMSVVLLAAASWLLLFTAECLYRADPANHTNPARRPAELAGMQPGPIYTTPRFRPWLATLYYANRDLPEFDPPGVAAIANASPDQPFSLMLVEGTDTHRNPQAEAFLQSFESESARQPVAISSWTDEHRRTALYVFGPKQQPTTSTQPAR